MYYTYVIKNEKDKIYIGQTNNLAKRIKRHNRVLPNKKNSFTSKNKGQWEYLHIEKFKIRKEAIFREKQLKSYQGRLSIKNKYNLN
jgi:putative endonuclease